jgi:hypothetical protein
MLPEAPVMVTIAFPFVTELPAVKVSLLVPLPRMLGGLKDAVTPLGRPDAASVTLPVNPLAELKATVVMLPAPA